MSLPKSWTTVTPLSKALALAIFISFPIIGFLLGVRYQTQISGTAWCTAGEMCSYSFNNGYPFYYWIQKASLHFLWVFPLIFIDMFLRGLALWNAGKNRQSGWFIALFLVNSLGILPLIYLLSMKSHKKIKK